jgi:aspartokinase
MQNISHLGDDYCLVTRGIRSSTVIGSKTVVQDIVSAFKNVDFIEHDVCGITIALREGHLNLPGVCANILMKIAESNVNLKEVSSSYSELTIIVAYEDLPRVVESLSSNTTQG